MKKFLLSAIVSFMLISLSVATPACAENSSVSGSQNTTVSTQTTEERTDDDPFAESKPSVEKETPTFYYILGGVTGVIIIFAIVGFATSKKKK